MRNAIGPAELLRRLGRAYPQVAAPPPPRGRARCVLVADTARARVLVLERRDDQDLAGKPSELIEVAEVSNPAMRARDVDVWADSRPGLRQAGRGGFHGPAHAVSDHREHHRHEVARHFAALVVEEAAGVWRRYPACVLIVAASPPMLGLLRPALARHLRAQDRIEVHELARDLTKLTGPMLHDVLADAALLPARGRLPPLVAIPGQPVG